MAGKIFISYARIDEKAVRQIYDELKGAGHNPWLDVEDILPGEDWQRAINKAIEETDFFIAVLSNNSVSRRGMIQKEIGAALDKMEGLLPEDLFMIPVRLDDCEIPERLAHLYVLDWDNGNGGEKLLKAIQVGLMRREEENRCSYPSNQDEYLYAKQLASYQKLWVLFAPAIHYAAPEEALLVRTNNGAFLNKANIDQFFTIFHDFYYSEYGLLISRETRIAIFEVRSFILNSLENGETQPDGWVKISSSSAKRIQNGLDWILKNIRRDGGAALQIPNGQN